MKNQLIKILILVRVLGISDFAFAIDYGAEASNSLTSGSGQPVGMCDTSPCAEGCPMAGTDYCIINKSPTTDATTRDSWINVTDHPGLHRPDLEDYTGTTTHTINTYANPALQKCITARILKSATDTRAADEFDCPTTELDSQGRLSNPADREYRNWNDTLYYGKSNTPITGFYSKKGARCEGLTAASKECPVAVKAKFVVNCDKDDPINTLNEKCAIAKDIKTYYAVYQEFPTPDEKPVKTRIVGDSTIAGNSSIAIPVPMAAINATTKSAYKCEDLQVTGGPPLFQKGVDQYGYPRCREDESVNKLNEKVCQMQMQGIWDKGGSSTAPCPIITVEKVFPIYKKDRKLVDIGTGWLPKFQWQTKIIETSINTSDCFKAKGSVFNDAGTNISQNLNTTPGGKLTGIVNQETFISKYKILNPTVPQMFCNVAQEEEKSEEFTTSGALILDSNYIPGSLFVSELWGGGGGGGSSSASVTTASPLEGSGGFGGKKAESKSGQLFVYTPRTCMVIIGKGGAGASASNDSCGAGFAGEASIITCGNSADEKLTANGGGGASTCGGKCNGSAGESGKGFGGPEATGCEMGNAGGYGAGGSGGATCNTYKVTPCGTRSGGNGGSGYAKIQYKVKKWVEYP
jgi:hypothetical protein